MADIASLCTEKGVRSSTELSRVRPVSIMPSPQSFIYSSGGSEAYLWNHSRFNHQRHVYSKHVAHDYRNRERHRYRLNGLIQKFELMLRVSGLLKVFDLTFDDHKLSQRPWFWAPQQPQGPSALATSLILSSATVPRPVMAVTNFHFCLCTRDTTTRTSPAAAFSGGYPLLLVFSSYPLLLPVSLVSQNDECDCMIIRVIIRGKPNSLGTSFCTRTYVVPSPMTLHLFSRRATVLPTPQDSFEYYSLLQHLTRLIQITAMYTGPN